MPKYYRVIKDNFLWKAGAVLQEKDSGTSKAGYSAVEDIWDTVPVGQEYISSHIIENPLNAEFFERVYPDTVAGKIYRTKDQVVELYNSAFK